MRRKLVDRRGRPRFEIVGRLSGSMEVAVRCPVRDLGLGGALIECSMPLAPGSHHQLTLDFDGQQSTVDVRVCHTRRGDGAEPVYYVGVEFCSPVAALAGAMGKRIVASDTPGGVNGV